MHKMCSDERKCAVMKGCFCSDELRRNKEIRGDAVDIWKKYKKHYLWSTTKKGHQNFGYKK